jgi:hypothetical protein
MYADSPRKARRKRYHRRGEGVGCGVQDVENKRKEEARKEADSGRSKEKTSTQRQAIRRRGESGIKVQSRGRD